MVYATLEHSALFYALPFEKVLDMFVDLKIDEAEEVQGTRQRFSPAGNPWKQKTSPDNRGIDKNWF
ncbi:MAG TPA: hypothetical protein VJL33_04250 [Candidatus Bathyarchaeia archaeon]|nr:hypothetical protein [Candidatus Bathyarchaeia archaeon]